MFRISSVSFQKITLAFLETTQPSSKGHMFFWTWLFQKSCCGVPWIYGSINVIWAAVWFWKTIQPFRNFWQKYYTLLSETPNCSVSSQNCLGKLVYLSINNSCRNSVSYKMLLGICIHFQEIAWTYLWLLVDVF